MKPYLQNQTSNTHPVGPCTFKLNDCMHIHSTCVRHAKENFLKVHKVGQLGYEEHRFWREDGQDILYVNFSL